MASSQKRRLERKRKRDGGTEEEKKRGSNPILRGIQHLWAHIGAFLWGPHKTRRSHAVYSCDISQTSRPIKQRKTLGASKMVKDEEREEPETVPPRAEQKTVPLTVETFKFHKVLGKGGFGKVVLATDSIRGDNVAIKILQKSRLNGCMVEGKVLQSVSQCKFLIHGLAAFHTQTHVYYVMELGRGGTLYDYIKSHGWLPINCVTLLAAELVCGLQSLHFRGIVHRDLKPENVMLTADGHVKISDFGLAVTSVHGKAKPRGIVGTNGYQAPEMLYGLPYNEGVDWFAYGVTLYEMLMRKHPFWVRNGNTNAMILNNEPSYMFLNFESANILQGLLRKDPSRRMGAHGRIRLHPFFLDINWTDLEAGRIKSPLQMATEKISTFLSMKTSKPFNPGKYKAFTFPEVYDDVCFVSPAWANHYHIAP